MKLHFIEQVKIVHMNVIDADCSSATALFVYLVPEGIVAIRNKLLDALQRGARVVTYGIATMLILC